MFDNNQSIFKKRFQCPILKSIQEKNRDLPFNFSEWGTVKDMQKPEDKDCMWSRLKGENQKRMTLLQLCLIFFPILSISAALDKQK